MILYPQSDLFFGLFSLTPGFMAVPTISLIKGCQQLYSTDLSLPQILLPVKREYTWYRRPVGNSV
jgi:hypothetical protein